MKALQCLRRIEQVGDENAQADALKIRSQVLVKHPIVWWLPTAHCSLMPVQGASGSCDSALPFALGMGTAQAE